jgi:hypothetical protein
MMAPAPIQTLRPIRTGQFGFALLERISKADGGEAHLFSARDTLERTTIGRIERGFDFLGYRFSRGRYGSPSRRFAITRQDCIGFTSNRERRPLESSVRMFTRPAGGVGAGPGW